jgi:hypothetical protein
MRTAASRRRRGRPGRTSCRVGLLTKQALRAGQAQPGHRQRLGLVEVVHHHHAVGRDAVLERVNRRVEGPRGGRGHEAVGYRDRGRRRVITTKSPPASTATRRCWSHCTPPPSAPAPSSRPARRRTSCQTVGSVRCSPLPIRRPARMARRIRGANPDSATASGTRRARSRHPVTGTLLRHQTGATRRIREARVHQQDHRPGDRVQG